MEYSFVGTIRGRIIELECDTSLPTGSKIRVNFQPVEPHKTIEQARAAILDSAGGWEDADDSEFGR